MRKEATIWTALLLVLQCSTRLQLVQATDDSDEVMSMKMSEVVDLLTPFAQNCDPVPEKSHLEEMVLNKEQASQQSKCFRRCLLMQFDVMPKDKLAYDGTKTIEMMNMMFPDKEEQSRTITEKCNHGNGLATECDNAHLIAMCMLDEMRKAGYKIPEIKE
ncbi:hypothetical protein KR093_002458 [Drosophila rubida]|uniref:Odorant-binding protein 19b n=1 Tax=Drosophila rubida TaxID=30044 RepID=A0AAD4KA55_9MUSC|nr:hypothetical protein KR093_002458 [Drosophila rubida]